MADRLGSLHAHSDTLSDIRIYAHTWNMTTSRERERERERDTQKTSTNQTIGRYSRVPLCSGGLSWSNFQTQNTLQHTATHCNILQHTATPKSYVGVSCVTYDTCHIWVWETPLSKNPYLTPKHPRLIRMSSRMRSPYESVHAFIKRAL